MALSTYTELKAAVADWLNRTDLTSQIVDFITLNEAEMKRRLRRKTTSTTIYIYAEATTLPADVASIETIRLSSGSPTQDKPLRPMSASMLSEREARTAGVAGRPDSFAFYAEQLHVSPEPDQSYDAIIVYNAQLTPLSGSVATNDVLEEAPDAYLYGTLLQAAPFLEHDERIPVWQAKFDNAIDQLNRVREEEMFNAQLKDVRLPRVFR